MNRRITLSIVYGLIFVIGSLFGLMLSFAAQPGGISQSNALIAPFMGPWSQILRPNPHPVSTWSAEYELFAKSLTVVLVLSLACSFIVVNDTPRYISTIIAVPALVVWVLAGLMKVVSQLA
jgi:hypothetical protein